MKSITIYQHNNDEWCVTWVDEIEVTVEETLQLQEIQDSDNLKELIKLISPWIHSVAKNLIDSSLLKLPIQLLGSVVADAPPFRNIIE